MPEKKQLVLLTTILLSFTAIAVVVWLYPRFAPQASPLSNEERKLSSESVSLKNQLPPLMLERYPDGLVKEEVSLPAQSGGENQTPSAPIGALPFFLSYSPTAVKNNPALSGVFFSLVQTNSLKKPSDFQSGAGNLLTEDDLKVLNARLYKIESAGKSEDKTFMDTYYLERGGRGYFISVRNFGFDAKIAADLKEIIQSIK